jgi:hypothetical protein
VIIELVIALVFLLTSGCVLNEKALLPGTQNYKLRQSLNAQMQQLQHSIEVSRLRVIEARYFQKEQDAHKQLTTGGDNG